MKRYLLAAFVAVFFVSGIQAKQWIVQLETGHPSAFGKGKAAFALAKNGVISKLPPQSRHIRDLGIINAIVVEADSADELWVEGVIAAQQVEAVEEVVLSVREGHRLITLPEGSSYLGFIYGLADTPERVEHALREAHALLNVVVAPLFEIEDRRDKVI